MITSWLWSYWNIIAKNEWGRDKMSPAKQIDDRKWCPYPSRLTFCVLYISIYRLAVRCNDISVFNSVSPLIKHVNSLFCFIDVVRFAHNSTTKLLGDLKYIKKKFWPSTNTPIIHIVWLCYKTTNNNKIIEPQMKKKNIKKTLDYLS